MKKILPHSICLDQSPVSIMLASLLNYFDDYGASTVFHQLQENGFSHSACDEVDSIASAELFKLITN